MRSSNSTLEFQQFYFFTMASTQQPTFRVQTQIRDSATRMQNALADLRGWETSIKKKDKQIRRSGKYKCCYLFHCCLGLGNECRVAAVVQTCCNEKKIQVRRSMVPKR